MRQPLLTGSCHCGAVRWTFDGDPGTATACNCTVCRRYGALWAYDWVDGRIEAAGETQAYTRPPHEIGFHFCPACGAVAFWRGVAPRPDGRTRIAVNLRLTDNPFTVQTIPIRRFDGLDRFETLPPDGRTVGDLWF